ncbi:hypothetical protein MtrunA17_Chr1g0193741 [Medicago truncatula]|uniref:Transmembrane protein n=1 Tax=Medicago truncatula TaxID=3880 RepID=A0A396K3G3_MEDTR|nr:hypothetical protein MtrunA17_Chr1g0193741 [Medicago truncatula]
MQVGYEIRVTTIFWTTMTFWIKAQPFIANKMGCPFLCILPTTIVINVKLLFCFLFGPAMIITTIT